MNPFLAKTPAQLGSILRGFRRQRGMTQAQVAARLGITQKAISLAETHPDHLPLSRLLAVLGALELELVVRDKSGSRAPKAEW